MKTKIIALVAAISMTASVSQANELNLHDGASDNIVATATAIATFLGAAGTATVLAAGLTAAGVVGAAGLTAGGVVVGKAIDAFTKSGGKESELSDVMREAAQEVLEEEGAAATTMAPAMAEDYMELGENVSFLSILGKASGLKPEQIDAEELKGDEDKLLEDFVKRSNGKINKAQARKILDRAFKKLKKRAEARRGKNS